MIGTSHFASPAKLTETFRILISSIFCSGSPSKYDAATWQFSALMFSKQSLRMDGVPSSTGYASLDCTNSVRPSGSQK